MPWRRSVTLLLAATAALAGCRGPEADDGPAVLVDIGAGTLRGSQHDGIRSWKGVPYAAAPVGDLRWRAPEPVEPWPDVRDAREYGWICPQALTGSLEGALGEVRSANEDCLTLNVHQPANADDDLPVMVWLHGGSFVYGSGSQQAYNSPELARRGVVLVTLNYRLGRLGFFAHPAVQEEGHRVANFGLLDQVAALEWVQDNIAEFGGDPDNVTVFGESAGAISVNSLMASPAADGLFARAISQSGFGREPTLTWDAATVEASNAVEEFAGPSPSAADLRALPADEVAKIPMDLLVGQAPILDEVLPETVSSTFVAGEEAEVPLLTGTTDLEISGDFVSPGPTVSAVRARLLEDPAPALAAYRTQEELDLHVLADIMFTEPARHLARRHADDAPTFRYLFTIAPGPTLESRGGAPHSSELPFVFDDTRRQGHPVEDADALADQVADLWVDFATDGEPDGWPPAETDEIMTFTLDGPVVEPDPWAARLDLVEQGYERIRGAASGS